MNYENYPYDIFNPMYLKNTYVQQLENWRNVEQQKNICDMVKAISDYCEAARKVAPDYQRMATDACHDGNCATDVDRQNRLNNIFCPEHEL